MSNSHLGKSVLIVDHKLEELSRLRDIVSSLGFEDIGAASSVNMAMSYLRESQFDVVLVAYDLGANEKNGLQVIQESYAEKLNLFQTLFLLIVDKESSSLLVGSLESAPDAYLYRPYDRAKIQANLEKLLRVKKAVLPMEEAMDRGEWKKATLFGAKLIHLYPGLKVYLERLQGICFIESGSYDAAEMLFSDIVEQRQQVWAQVGLGMSYYYLSRYKEAADTLQSVIDQQHISVEAFLWFARSVQAGGENDQAIVLMRKAIMLQPTVPQLRSELGNMAAVSEDWDVAIDSFKEYVKFARHTVFQEADHYYALAKAMLKSHQKKSADVAELEMGILKIMESVIRDFGEEGVIKLRAHVTLYEIRSGLGNSTLAESELQLAVEEYKKLSTEEQTRWIDWMVDSSEDTRFYDDFYLHKNKLLQGKDKKPWVASMVKGLLHFKKREFTESFNSFRASLEQGGSSGTLALNLVQAGIEARKSGDENFTVVDWGQCLNCLQKLNYGGLSEKQFQRLIKLLQRYSEIHKETQGNAG